MIENYYRSRISAAAATHGVHHGHMTVMDELSVNNLSKVATQRLEVDSNLRPSGYKAASTAPRYLVPQATAGEGLAHGLYVAARVGFEPATLRTKGTQSTTEPTLPICVGYSRSNHLIQPVPPTP